jgi:hypothetical protein
MGHLPGIMRQFGDRCHVESTWELHFRVALWALPAGEKFVENLALAVIGS